MISPQSRTKNWILGIREQASRKDPILIEKMIMALTLAENLKLAGLDFTFKGGTAMLLLLQTPKRFSIDIYIVTKSLIDIDLYLKNVLNQGVFTYYTENLRPGSLPKQHFKFYFESVIQQKESYVLLDILYEENLYPELIPVKIQSPILLLDGHATTVFCPTREALIGDKLTAFAPHTTGIPYKAGKELEIAKQLFDIASLFDQIERLQAVKDSFETIAQKELKYRAAVKLTTNDVLWDAFKTSVLIGLRQESSGEFLELSQGIKKLSAYLYTGYFSIDTAILCASKTAYLCSLLLTNLTVIDRFQKKITNLDEEIQAPLYQKLNKLKKTNPEAFYYFHHALSLLDLSKRK